MFVRMKRNGNMLDIVSCPCKEHMNTSDLSKADQLNPLTIVHKMYINLGADGWLRRKQQQKPHQPLLQQGNEL